jgi:hypothetical protein
MSKQKVWIVAADEMNMKSPKRFHGQILRICSSFEEAEKEILEYHEHYVKVKEGIYKIPDEIQICDKYRSDTLKLFSGEIDEYID